MVLNKAAPSGATEGSPAILLTGCGNGVGYEACKEFLRRGCRVWANARSEERKEEILRRLGEDDDDGFDFSPAMLTLGTADLASLGSIKSYVSDLGESGVRFDSVCFNAGLAKGLSQKTVTRTKDGFEETFGVNHVAHFAMLEYGLKDMLSKEGCRIVVTASGVHDPESPGGKQGKGATLGNLEGLVSQGKSCQMLDGGEYDPDKAYKDSKLCNVLFTKECQRRYATLGGSGQSLTTVNCLSPGLIVSSGLFREQNKIFTKIFDIAATNLFRVGETQKWGGGALAYLALSENLPSGNAGGLFYAADPGDSKYGEAAYGEQFRPRPISKEAQDTEKGEKLWELTKELI